MALRTGEQFDEWFRRSGGDPWGYESPHVRGRLARSLAFIGEHIKPGFSGSFVEMGAFKGQFTERLAKHFSAATVAAIDISPLAVAAARQATVGCRNVIVSCGDLAAFEIPPSLPTPRVLLLMECLYYLPRADWAAAIGRGIAALRGPSIFISSPVAGDPYPKQRELYALFRNLGYAAVATRVVSRRRLIFPNQVMYLFSA